MAQVRRWRLTTPPNADRRHSARGWVLLTIGLAALGCAVALLVWGRDNKGVGEAIGLLTGLGAWLCTLGAMALGFVRDVAERLRLGAG